MRDDWMLRPNTASSAQISRMRPKTIEGCDRPAQSASWLLRFLKVSAMLVEAALTFRWNAAKRADAFRYLKACRAWSIKLLYSIVLRDVSLEMALVRREMKRRRDATAAP